jgi:hypothetical protein
MDPSIIYLMVATIYLVLIPYGIVRTRNRGLPPRVRLVTAAFQIFVLPVALFAMLFLSRDAFVIAGWGIMLGAMTIAGIVVAIATELIARRVRP